MGEEERLRTLRERIEELLYDLERTRGRVSRISLVEKWVMLVAQELHVPTPMFADGDTGEVVMRCTVCESYPCRCSPGTVRA